MRWWTADLHLGHANICRYCGRPYGGVEEMNLDLVARWNDRVAPDDEIYVLGDVAMGRISESLPLVRALQGHKALVPGNHDRCWEGLRSPKSDTVDYWIDAYRAVGFEIVSAPVQIELAGHIVGVDHFPYQGDSQDEDRYTQFRPEDRGDWLLHGHVHEKWRQSGRMINVGVDAWGGYPVAESTIVDLISGGPRELPPLPWAL